VRDAMTRRAVEVSWQGLALGHEVFEIDGATFVRNTVVPDIYDANFVFGVTASEPDAIERVLARTLSEYRHAAQLTFRIDPFSPPAFEARLVLDGYERSDALILVLDGELRAPLVASDIRPIDDEAGWQAYATLKRLDFAEHATSVGRGDDAAVANRLALSNRLKCPPVRYALAYQGDQPVGFCNSWGGVNGTGQVEDLFVHPLYRHRGIATALLRYCVDDARARGAQSIVIVAEPTNTPKNMYAALGWRPVAVCRQYGKPLRVNRAPDYGRSRES
jgi:ribosomal protein S18 acetylase RimI-like enzyme